MAPMAVSSYELSLFVHITAVVVGFGATFAEAIAFPLAMKLDPRHLPYVHQLQLAINQRFTTPALVIVLATGIYQVVDGDYDFGDPWIGGSFAIILLLGGLIGAYFIPTDRKLGPMAEREIEGAAGGQVTLSEEYQRAARTEGILGAVAGVLIVIAIFLMVVKPGA